MNGMISKQRNKKTRIFLVKIISAVMGLVLFSLVIALSRPTAERVGFLSAVLNMPGSSGAFLEEESGEGTDFGATDMMNFIEFPIVSDTILNEQEESNAFSTPKDIVELMNKAQADIGKSEKGGSIVEQKYTSGSPYTGYKDLWVMNTTGKTLDLSSLYSAKPKLDIVNDKPSILIYHTHTSESYVTLDLEWYPSSFTSRSSDCGQNMVRVGEAMVDELEKAGFNVIHDKTIYDTSYNGSYQRSRAQVEMYLELYPSIVITLDVHRDALTTNNEQTIIKPVAEVNGKKAAQIMLIAGREGNTITSFPNWENNLKFAVQIQNKMNEMYPEVMRPLFHCYRMYNMDLTPNSLLVEVGTHGNTLEEAVYSGTLFGKALAEMLSDYIST